MAQKELGLTRGGHQRSQATVAPRRKARRTVIRGRHVRQAQLAERWTPGQAGLAEQLRAGLPR